MDVIADRRFQSKSYLALKKRLDSLRYCEPLSLESAPLVEKLLNDLLKTTEGFQQLKKLNFEANSKLKSLTESILPLQAEVSSLMKKNNELHLHLMSTKEDFDSKDSFWRASVKKLERENSDLNFLVEKTKDDLLKIENQNSELRTRLDSLMTKTYASQRGILEAKDNNLGKLQSFELSKPLNSGSFEGFSKPDSVWANELRSSDERIKKLQTENETLKKTKNITEDETKRLKNQLENRNLEISRLSSMIGADFKPEVITNKYKESITNSNIEQLNDRIDYLNKENVKLEAEYKKARQGQDKFFELEKENKFMVENLFELRTQNQNLGLKLAELEKLGKNLNGPELEKLKTDNNELLNRLKAYEDEIKQLKDESLRTEAYKNNFYADKKAYTQAIEKIDKERENLRAKLTDFEVLVEENQNELADSREKEILYQSQIQNLRKEIENIQNTYSKINKDHLSTTEESYQLRQKLSSLESQKNIIQAELDSVKFELERTLKLKKMTEDQLEEVKKEIIRYKNDFESANAQKQKLQVLYDSSVKEVNNLKEEITHLLKLREKDKQALIESEDRQRDLNNQLARNSQSTRIIQNEHQNISDELASKLEEIRKISSLKLALEQELAELRPLKQKYLQLVEETHNIKNSALNKESIHTKLQRQIDLLEDSLRNKEITINEQKNVIERYQETINKLENDIENERDHAAILNSNAKQSEYLNNEASSLRQQINDYREKEKDSLRTIEQLKSELKKAAEAVKNLQKQLQRTTELKQSLENDIEKLKSQTGVLQNKEFEVQNEQVKLQEKAFQADLTIEELKRQVGHEQHNRFRLEDEVKHLQNVLENEKSASLRLQEQNLQLKSLISNLEKLKEDLLKKIQYLNSDKNIDEDQKSQLTSEISLLRKELANKNSENVKLTEAIKGIDQERDYIQSLLDQKTEDFVALENSLSNLQKDSVLLKDSLASLSSKEVNSVKRLDEKDFSIKKLVEKCKHLESELDETRAAYSMQARQIQEMNEHLIAITKENQYVNDELMKTTHEKENLKKFFEDKSRNERLSQQLTRSVEREKEDLLLTYKKACEENDRLNLAVSAITMEQRETYGKLQACEQELLNAQNHIAQQDHAIFNLQQEINTLERQVSHLTYQLENSERKASEMVEIKESFLREVNSARQVALNVEASKDDLIRKLSSAENEKLILESKIRSMHSEFSAMKSQAEVERQRCEELQIMLAKERETLFKTQKDLGKMEINKGYDEDLVHNQLQQTRNQVMNLEMEVLKLKEENGKYNHKIHKYETKIKDLEGEMNKTSAAYRYADDWDT